MFHEMEEWSTMLQCNTVAKLNRIIKEDHAGVIIQGKKTIEEVGEEAFAMFLRVLNGEMTKNEAIQYVSTMDIYCLGPVI